MRKSILIMLAAVLPAVGALAEQPSLPKSGNAATSGKLLPLKGAASANSCAAYGPGFVKVESTGTCVKIGGAVRVDVGGSAGSR